MLLSIVQYSNTVGRRIGEALYYLWDKRERISGFDLLPCLENCIFVFWSVETPLARTSVVAIDSSSKTITITAGETNSMIKLMEV